MEKTAVMVWALASFSAVRLFADRFGQMAAGVQQLPERLFGQRIGQILLRQANATPLAAPSQAQPVSRLT